GAAAHQIDRIEALHQIRRDGDYKAGLAVARHAHDGDHSGADLLLAVVRKALQVLDLDARHHTGQQLHVANLAHAVAPRTLAAPHSELAPGVGHFALQPPAIVHERRDALRQLFKLNLELRSAGFRKLSNAVCVVAGGVTGQRLDATHACSNAALAHHGDETDI